MRIREHGPSHTCVQVHRHADTRYTQPASYFWASGKIICFDKVNSLNVVSKYDLFLWLSGCWNISWVNWQQEKHEDRDAGAGRKINKDRRRIRWVSLRHKISLKGNISGLICLFSNGFLALRLVCSSWKTHIDSLQVWEAVMDRSAMFA